MKRKSKWGERLIKLYRDKKGNPHVEWASNAGFNTASGEFLAAVGEQYPGCTLKELRDILADKNKFLPDYDLIKALDEAIKRGCGDYKYGGKT